MSSYTSAWAQSPLLHSAFGYSCSILPRLSLLAQKRQVSGQPPIAHIQPYRCACPVRTAALDQPLGINAVYYRPAVDVPVFSQYHISTHSCALLHTLIHGYPVIIQASATFSPKDIRLVHTHASYSNQPIAEFISNNCGNWILALDVPIPKDLVQPALTSLSYTVKCSTANDRLARVV
jgi:hypothetical protein